MNLRETPFPLQIALPLTLFVVGIGVTMWLAPIPDDELTTAQSDLLTTADWIIKVSVGALLGIGSNAGIRARNGSGTTK